MTQTQVQTPALLVTSWVGGSKLLPAGNLSFSFSSASPSVKGDDALLCSIRGLGETLNENELLLPPLSFQPSSGWPREVRDPH